MNVSPITNPKSNAQNAKRCIFPKSFNSTPTMCNDDWLFQTLPTIVRDHVPVKMNAIPKANATPTMTRRITFAFVMEMEKMVR